jgi:hypothetical protein
MAIKIHQINEERKNRTFMSNIFQKENDKKQPNLMMPRTPDSVGRFKKFEKKNLI